MNSERAAVGPSRASGGGILRSRWLTVLALTVVFGVAGWLGRESVLRFAADFWIVSDRPVTADAVAIFGGGLDSRPFAAADYYKQGLAGKILLANIGASRAERIGVLRSHVESNRKVLVTLGVPEAAIETFGEGLTNTYEEALALRDWAARTGARNIIVPTEIFTARRVRWTLHRVFNGDTIIHVTALEPLDYRRENWWRHEAGLIGFQNEIIKYVYYRFKY
jgi:uncharacterized SAM-binding protein YcdF (DUF218 family)